MTQLICDRCNGMLYEVVGNVPFESKLIGSVSVPNVSHIKCNKCDHYLISFEGSKQIYSFLDEQENEAIKLLPIGDFVSPKQACQILGFTKQAFSKNHRIKRGFILSITIDGKKLYNRKSVVLFKATNDGRFLIKQPEAVTRWSNVVQNIPVMNIYPNIESSNIKVTSAWKDVPLSLLYMPDNYENIRVYK